MEMTKDIHVAMKVGNQFSEIENAGNVAESAISTFLSKLYEQAATKEEVNAIKAAANTIYHIKRRHGQFEAANYLKDNL